MEMEPTNKKYPTNGAPRGYVNYAQEAPENGRFTVTPEVAELWLREFNVKNRPIHSTIDNLTRSLTNGEWVYNGDPIVFSRHRLMNGQHRLLACARSGVPLDTEVRTGVDDSAYDTYDNHRKRTSADHFAADGYSSASSVGAAAVWIWRYENGQLPAQRTWTPVSHLKEVVTRYPWLMESLVHRETFRIKNASRFSGASALHALLYQWPEEREAFFTKLIAGDGLEIGSPILVLRDRLLSDRLARRRMVASEKFAIYIKAWNAVRIGKSLQVISYREGGDHPEAFPRIIGWKRPEQTA